MLGHPVKDGAIKCLAIQSRMRILCGWPFSQGWGYYMVGHSVKDWEQNGWPYSQRWGTELTGTGHFPFDMSSLATQSRTVHQLSWLAGLTWEIFKLAVRSKMGVIH